MSASLVGSEMCIRDRRFTRALSSFLPSPSGGATAAPDPHPEKCLRYRACLLYTSDAADDM
eukprot:1142315-Alexandrium_andersonii.AAC.1